MDSLARSDIFFIITTFAVVILTIVGVVIAVYIFNIVKDVRYIARKAKDESDRLSEDLQDIRHHLKKRGFGVITLGGLVKSIINRHRTKKR